MLPLTLLKTAEGQAMLIELKNGESYSGKLVSCNMFMNILLRDVVLTSKEGDRFWKMPECYIRGNSIKYLRIPEEVLDLVIDEQQSRKDERRTSSFISRGGRGSRVGEGRGQYVPNNSSGRGGYQGSRGGGGGRGGGDAGGSSGRGSYQGGRGQGGDGGGRGGGRGGRNAGESSAGRGRGRGADYKKRPPSGQE